MTLLGGIEEAARSEDCPSLKMLFDNLSRIMS
jgi:hypothetical protein